jgi:hypothetical protein
MERIRDNFPKKERWNIWEDGVIIAWSYKGFHSVL